MNLKKILAGAVAAGMLWCNCAVSAAALPQKQSPMRDITTAELVKDMGIGINLAIPMNPAATGSPSGATARRNPMRPPGAVR